MRCFLPVFKCGLERVTEKSHFLRSLVGENMERTGRSLAYPGIGGKYSQGEGSDNGSGWKSAPATGIGTVSGKSVDA